MPRQVQDDPFIGNSMLGTLGPLMESEPHRFVIDASDAGFPIGYWPASVKTDLGNGQPFVQHFTKRDADGDLLWVDYRQALGCTTLRVYND